ncbi:leukosialin isoform X1 [Crotalus tigris]|uniref:leukosialin isoform X1 n=2 Tax=Crotalus tigris TaxID=88082 RepID=UPI00192F5319|nr:leukosialin isoform X1 [Crotalus tigris]XP_039186230.1 leukosialin isoform X1 [Crotalus tigris]XP_039186231.1 leukosialin isoform X1 [Crotalus tigris]
MRVYLEGEEDDGSNGFFIAITYSTSRGPGLGNSATMEKSRFLFQQVIGHKMLFVVFLLFPTDILIEGQNTSEVIDPQNVATYVSTTSSLNISNSSFVVSPKVISMTPVMSSLDATMSGILSRSMSTSVQPASSLRAAPPVSKQELHSSTVMNAVAPEDTSSPMPSTVTVSTEGKKSHREAAEVRESTTPLGQKEVSSKMTVTPHFDREAAEVRESTTPLGQKEISSKMTITPHFDSEKVSSPTKDFGTRSQGSFLEQSSHTIAYTETTKSTKSKQGRKGPISPDQAVPELTQTPETGSHHPSGPFTTLVTSTNNASKSDTADQSPSETKRPVIILVVVVSILLLVGLIAFLYFRRRRHSGSTSFNAPEWPGQATLPDDTGLDKDVEQQVGAVGEGETRRGTLVTFFGKRQSRVPSIAMEDMNGKGGMGETEQLLCGEAETGSTSQATGDANGKVSEPLKDSS